MFSVLRKNRFLRRQAETCLIFFTIYIGNLYRGVKMRLGSWMYGACAQIAVTVFAVCSLVLALPVVSLFIMVLNGMQDAVFVVFSILLLLLFYALGWIWKPFRLRVSGR